MPLLPSVPSSRPATTPPRPPVDLTAPPVANPSNSPTRGAGVAGGAGTAGAVGGGAGTTYVAGQDVWYRDEYGRWQASRVNSRHFDDPAAPYYSILHPLYAGTTRETEPHRLAPRYPGVAPPPNDCQAALSTLHAVAYPSLSSPPAPAPQSPYPPPPAGPAAGGLSAALAAPYVPQPAGYPPPPMVSPSAGVPPLHGGSPACVHHPGLTASSAAGLQGGVPFLGTSAAAAAATPPGAQYLPPPSYVPLPSHGAPAAGAPQPPSTASLLGSLRRHL